MGALIRGIAAGLSSGSMAGIIFTIMASVAIYVIGVPFLPASGASSLFGMFDILGENAGASVMLLLTMVPVALAILGTGVATGLASGILASMIIPRVRIKPIFTSTVLSAAIILPLAYAKIEAVASIVPAMKDGLGQNASFGFLAGLYMFGAVSFALVEGFLLNYYWGKYGPAKAAEPAPDSENNSPKAEPPEKKQESHTDAH